MLGACLTNFNVKIIILKLIILKVRFILELFLEKMSIKVHGSVYSQVFKESRGI